MKIVLILFGILVILGILICSIIYFELTDNDIEFQGVKISQEDYQAMKELNKDNIDFKVCNLETKDCIRFINIDKVMELENQK